MWDKSRAVTGGVALRLQILRVSKRAVSNGGIAENVAEQQCSETAKRSNRPGRSIV
jgi:hypothetical protein